MSLPDLDEPSPVDVSLSGPEPAASADELRKRLKDLKEAKRNPRLAAEKGNMTGFGDMSDMGNLADGMSKVQQMMKLGGHKKQKEMRAMLNSVNPVMGEVLDVMMASNGKLDINAFPDDLKEKLERAGKQFTAGRGKKVEKQPEKKAEKQPEKKIEVAPVEIPAERSKHALKRAKQNAKKRAAKNAAKQVEVKASSQ